MAKSFQIDAQAVKELLAIKKATLSTARTLLLLTRPLMHQLTQQLKQLEAASEFLEQFMETDDEPPARRGPKSVLERAMPSGSNSSS